MDIAEKGTTPSTTTIRIKGVDQEVPSAVVDGATIIVTGGSLKIAKLHDEELVEGDPVGNPIRFVESLRRSGLGADLFTFSERPNSPRENLNYSRYVENWAVIRTNSFQDWWENRLPQESRKNARRAAKRGVIVKSVPFSDSLVEGIRLIYNETPIRQGKPFWHYGKSFEAVKRENITYLDRSEFIGAYLGDELIGFIKVIYVDKIAVMIQILAKNAHHDKRPMNALLSATVEVCEKKGCEFLTYGQYVYDGKQNSSLTEFKRRNGFEELRFHRYYVPLTLKGTIALKTGLHRGIKNAIPGPVTEFLLKVRGRILRSWYDFRSSVPQES